MTGTAPPARQCTMPACEREATDPDARGSLCEHHHTALTGDSPAEIPERDASDPGAGDDGTDAVDEDTTASDRGEWTDLFPADPDRRTYPRPQYEHEYWMAAAGVDGKQPFAIWGNPDAPANCGEDGHTTAHECDCDARWKWSYRGHYRDGATAELVLDDEQIDALTYILQDDEPTLLVDGDKVVDPETGVVHPRFLEILARFGLTYADVSLSETGTHAIYQGALPEGVKQATWELDDEPWGANDEPPSIEIYDHGRVCVMTGKHVPGTPTEAYEIDGDAIEDVLNEHDQLPERREWEDVADEYDAGATTSDETTDDIRDVFAALERLDARQVADETIVHRWNDSASTSGDNRAFVPVWGRSANGTANIVNRDIWQDTGGGGYGGPAAMASIALGDTAPDHAGRGAPVKRDWFRAVGHLRALGFDIPEYDPDEGGGGDVEPTAALALTRLQALDDGQRDRYRQALPADRHVLSTAEVSDRIRDSLESTLQDEGYAVLQAPTGGNKTGVAAETPWRDVNEAITGDRPVVLFSETTDARDEAVERAREAGLEFLVFRGAAELCPLVAGDYDPANIDEDDPDAPAPILFDGEPAGEWFARQTTQKGVPISVAHRDAEERLRRRGRECPCCPGEQECRTKTQWPDDGLTEDDGHPQYDLVIATDPFAYVPSLRANTNVLHDEQPTYEEDFGLDAPTPEAVTARVRRAVTAFLRESDTGPDTFEELVELARACARCDATPWNEHAAPEEKPDEELGRRWIQTFSALEYEPERRWYLRNPDAHTLAPALARAIWKAIAGDVDRVTEPDERGGGIFDTNGRAKATVSHSPPRLDEDARADDGWNRTHVTVTFDDENTIRGVRNAPDFSTARSVVGLDARPTAWLWQRNVHPDMTTERVLDIAEARLWRRYERGQTVVQVGDATRPAGKEGRYFNARHARALVERLREHFGSDWGVGTAKAVASAAAGDEVDVGFRELLLDVGVPEDVVDDFIMTYGEEKSRNDFADLLAGLVYGCIDPGDDYVLDLLAECGLDANPERSEPCEDCNGDGCHECDGTGRKRAHGREFVGPDADHAAELLESVRATHVAQMVGRFGRNVDVENGDRCLTFVATDAVPEDLVDYQVMGVEWLATDLHRDILDELSARPNATTRELADAAGCTKEHVRQTLVRFEERGTVRRCSRAGPHGADEWTAGEGGTARLDDVQLRLDEIANLPVQSSCTWELAICDRHAASGVDEARDGHGEDVATDGGVSIGGDPPPDDPA